MRRRVFVQFVRVLLLAAPTAALAAPNAAIHAACHEDAKRLCAAVFGNLEAVRGCMREHHEQLSDKCKAAIVESKRNQSGAQGKNPQVRSFEHCLRPAGLPLQAKARCKASARALHAWRADTS
jgi:hypothetical protein